MTAAGDVDLTVRIGEWLPTLLFLLTIYAEDPDAVYGLLEPGMPLFDACPIDVTAAWLAVVDMVCSVGDVGPDQLAALLRSVGATLTEDPPTNTEGSNP